MGDGGRSGDTRAALPLVQVKCAGPPRRARARFDSAPLFSQNIGDGAKESCQKKLILVNARARSGSADERIQHLLQPRMLEVDLELVPLLSNNLPVAELAVEHALAELQVGAALVA